MALLTTVTCAPASAAPSAAQSDAAACPAANAMPTATVSAARSEQALLCLINRERAHAGARPLRANRCLARAAEGHARDMVRRRYFQHSSPDGRDFAARILATGYAPPSARWTVGENLAWGAAPAGDAAWVVNAWMNSRAHRENLLRGSFRDIGLAAVAGAPVGGDGPRATWAAEFGALSGGRGRCG
ncbi:MAG TPA: CAP domain-containing protein [Conexibacter sp.]|nr:CAP domain-containing protein [Conexibacter sp.]